MEKVKQNGFVVKNRSLRREVRSRKEMGRMKKRSLEQGALEGPRSQAWKIRLGKSQTRDQADAGLTDGVAALVAQRKKTNWVRRVEERLEWKELEEME